MPRTEFKKTLFGGMRVSYDCPACRERLTSPLREAGMRDSCPDCRAQFVVPGALRLREEAKRSEDLRIKQDELMRGGTDACEGERFAESDRPTNAEPVNETSTNAHKGEPVGVSSSTRVGNSQQTPLFVAFAACLFMIGIFLRFVLQDESLGSKIKSFVTPVVPRLTGTLTRDDVRATLREMEDNVPETLRDMEDNIPTVIADMESEMMKNAGEYGLSASDVRDQMQQVESSARQQIKDMEPEVRQQIRDMEDEVMRQLRSSGY